MAMKQLFEEGTMNDSEHASVQHVSAQASRPQVVLMQYRNDRYEPIYAYVRMEGDKAELLRQAAEGGFEPTGLGRVVASGRGEPSEEIRAIIAARYDCFCRYVRQHAPRAAMA